MSTRRSVTGKPRPYLVRPRGAANRPVRRGPSREDARRFRDGRHYRLYEVLGAQPGTVKGRRGVTFSVWAPAAAKVSVVGDFNSWDREAHPLACTAAPGIWSGFVEGVGAGALYKYHLESRFDGLVVDKADPFAFRCETPPGTASVVCAPKHRWGDADWMQRRSGFDAATAPMSIYELHLGSWKRTPDGAAPGYRQLADELVPYLTRMGFTHVELLPPMEHPFYGSWGYQVTSYFAPTSRYGEPADLMELIDRLHQAGIGVVLDWVPSHFPGDEHGLRLFDGTHLFEHADPRRGFHPDWTSYIFNYERNEVRSFLISSALFWLDRYHVDAIRVDAVASMLYRDYSRKEGEWIPNRYGGRENLEAIDFLRELNQAVHEHYPGVTMIAEESTAWPMVSRPAHLGGLGFDMKWDMGWMHDTLNYLAMDPIHRKYHHNALTFRMLYAYSERFVLPLSHDEVVHGKSSLLGKMFGDYWQKFAHLRALLGYMHALPGKKLLFMGGELGQWGEWNHDAELDWSLLDYPHHRGLQRWLADLNRLHRTEPALHARDFEPAGFDWIDCRDADQSAISFARHGPSCQDTMVVICNFTPVPRHNYRVGLPSPGIWAERLNGDAEAYGGSGLVNPDALQGVPIPFHGRSHSVTLTVPPLAVVFLKREAVEEPIPEDLARA